MRTRTQEDLLRATSLLARTMYRELRRADYSQSDVLAFVNEIVELLTSDAREQRPTTTAPARIVDPESGLVSLAVVLEVLDFELRRAQREDGRNELLLACYELELPSWMPDDDARGAKEALTRALRATVRASDTVGKVSDRRFVVLLPGTPAAALDGLGRRLAEGFLARLPEASRARSAASLKLTRRHVVSTPAARQPGELMGRCLSLAAVEVPLPAELSMDAQVDAAAIPARRRRGDLRRARSSSEGLEVVLALGGGAARAMTHIGVLRVLRAAGIRVVGVAGTSAGAIVGALFAAGTPEDEILDRFARFPSTPLYRAMRRSFVEFRTGGPRGRARERYFRESSMAFLSERAISALSREQFQDFIEALAGPDRDITSLRLPFAAVATDLVAGRTVVLSHGDLHAALRASCAVPGLFPPERDGDRVLVDGAAVCEVPVTAALQLGLRAPTLAVYLERPTHRVDAFASSSELATRAAALVHAELVREQLRHAPLLLRVPVHEVAWLDFRRARAIADLGEATAAAALDGLLERIG